MKKRNIIISLMLIGIMLLSACVPGVEQASEEPTEAPKEPDEQDPQTYPVEKPDEMETGDVSGKVAYICDPQASSEELQKIAQTNNAFALALYQLLIDGQGNLVYSPYSIYQALMMTYTGAEGETAAQMAEVLGVTDSDVEVHNLMNALNKTLTTVPDFGDMDIQPLIFNIANALWAQADYHFEQEFLDTLSANYNAGLKLVDFSDFEAARKVINLWVEAQTNEKIKDLIPEGVLNELTRLVLTNAVYFKGAWQHQFDASGTQKEGFRLLDGSEIQVDTMHASMQTGAWVSETMSAVRLPYEGGNFAMALIKPADLVSFEEDLDAEMLNTILQDLNLERAQVNLGLPKFKIESSVGLSETLKAMGMTDAFNSELADLSGMTGAKELYIQDVIHKAFIEVNEEGTEAAAATAVVVGMTSMPAQSYTINFDSPFMYVIYEQSTNTVVFMGRIVQP